MKPCLRMKILPERWFSKTCWLSPLAFSSLIYIDWDIQYTRGKIDRKHKRGRLHNSHQKCLRDTLGVWPCMASCWHISVSHDTTEFFLKELAPAYFPSSAGGLSHHVTVKNVICSPTGSKGELSYDLSSLMNNIPLDAYCNANTSSLYLLILSASCRCVGGCISQVEFIQELHI